VKEFVIIPRLVYTGILVFIGENVAFSLQVLTMVGFIGASTLVIVVSFAFQYYVLRPMMKSVDVRGRRAVGIFWLVLSFAAGLVGMYLLSAIDWTQARESLLNDFGWRMSFYLTAVAAFVAGACERRAFTMHNAL